MTVHQCPKCELRFDWKTEVDDHCWHDHPEFRHDYPATAPPPPPPPPPPEPTVEPAQPTPPAHIDVASVEHPKPAPHPPTEHKRLRGSLVGWLRPTHEPDSQRKPG